MSEQPAGSTSTRPSTADVEALYSQYPYPKADRMQWSDPARWDINMTSGRWTTTPLREDGRVLVTGCGTLEALIFHLNVHESRLESVIKTVRSLIDPHCALMICPPGAMTDAERRAHIRHAESRRRGSKR